MDVHIPLVCVTVLLFLNLERNFVYSQGYLDTTYLATEVIVYFASDQHILSSVDSSQLLDLRAKVADFDSSYFVIEAHTDSDGAETYNEQLSVRRARSVWQLLTSGTDFNPSVLTKSYGETRPINNNDGEDEKAANRRVAVRLYARQRMTVLSGTLLGDSTNLPVQGQVLLYAKYWSDSTWSDAQGKYELIAPIKEDVVVEVRAPEYLPQFESVEIKPMITSKPYVIRTSSIKPGHNFQLLNLNFWGNSSFPLPGSRRALSTVGRFMQKNTSVCIEIQGHINDPDGVDVSNDSKPFFLSVARARLVYDYLQLVHEIGDDRMYYRGYGDWYMLYPRARSERHQRLNRRVEIHVCRCADSKTLANSTGSDAYEFYRLEGRNNLFN